MTTLTRILLACLCLAAAGCSDSQQAQDPAQDPASSAGPAPTASPAAVAGEAVYAFGTGKNGAVLLKEGWHGAEADHVWSRDASAHVSLPVGEGAFKRAELTFGIYRPSPASEKLIRFSLNGAQVAEYKAAADTPTQQTDSVTVPFDLPAQAAGNLDLKIDVQSPESPSQHDSSDTRVLGVAVQQLVLK